jgi:putative glutamine transport system substrate-binding protein
MRIFTFLSLVLLLPLSVNAQLSGDSYASAKASGKATWTFTYANAPGFAEVKQGQAKGIAVDLMKAFEKYVEEQKGIQITVKYASGGADNFTKFLGDVKSAKGGVFGLSNTTITQARKASYTFSPAYITNIGMIISHKDVPTLSSLSDIGTTFSGMSAVTVKNSTNAKRLQQIKSKYFPSLVIEYVPSFQEVMNTVASDKRKFTDIDFTYYLASVQARNPVKRHPGGDVTTEKFGIIMPKSNDWAPLLKEFMESGFVGSMEYKKIISNNLGSSAMKYLEAL